MAIDAPSAGMAMILNRTGITRRGATIGHPTSAGSRMPGLRKHEVVLVDLLIASLTVTQAPITGAERDELRSLLEAMDMPPGPLAGLNAQG